MLDDFDPLLVGVEGTRKMRIVGAIVGALVGGLIGFLFGFATVQIVPVWIMIGYIIICATAGGLLGALFAGFIFIALFVVVVGSAVFFFKYVLGI